MNKSERNKIKKEIVKALTDKDTGIFDKKEGYAIYNGTNLDMVVQCVFNGLNKMVIEKEREAAELELIKERAKVAELNKDKS